MSLGGGGLCVCVCLCGCVSGTVHNICIPAKFASLTEEHQMFPRVDRNAGERATKRATENESERERKLNWRMRNGQK